MTIKKGSSFPQIIDAFKGWLFDMYTIKTTQSIDANGDKVVTEVRKKFEGVIQPLSPKQIALKPDDQRSWKWYMIHVFDSKLNLDTDDIVEAEGDRFKIMGLNGYERNNYLEYHCIKDYEDE